MAQPPALAPGQIYRHPRYYQLPVGVWHTKYLLLLATDKSGDFVFRLLTSRHGSPDPRCFHGVPYPTFYLGVLGGPLDSESAVDLRPEERELEAVALRTQLSRSEINLILTLDRIILCDVLECASRAEDTTERHAQFMRDQMARLDCK